MTDNKKTRSLKKKEDIIRKHRELFQLSPQWYYTLFKDVSQSIEDVSKDKNDGKKEEILPKNKKINKNCPFVQSWLSFQNK